MSLSLNINKLDNKELVAFGQSVENAVKNLQGVETAVVPFQNLLIECVDAINNAHEKTKAKDVSIELKELDSSRGAYFVGLSKLIEAHEYHPDEKVQASAIRLSQLINSLGQEVYRQSYDKESVSIKSLLNDLKGDYATDIKLVHALDFVKALDTCQSSFDKAREKQLNENVVTTEIVTMSSLRNSLEKSIRSILNIVPAFYSINPTPEYKDAISLIRESIKKAK